MKTDVLLSYGWVRSTYATLRDLYNHNLLVDTCDCSKVGMCQMSRFVKSKHIYTDPLLNKKQFCIDIFNLLNNTKPRLFLPSHDETVTIAENVEFYPKETLIPIPHLDQLQLANDKSQMQEFAQKKRVTCATRISYQTVNDLLSSVAEGQKTVVRLRRGNSAKGVFYATGPKETSGIVDSVIKKFNCSDKRLPVVQNYVDGEGWGVSCLYWNGERIAHFTHRRLREKTITGGTSTLREHQPNSLLEQMAFTLLDALKWHGLAMVEFKYDPVNKKAYFIEINPRLWGSIHLAISAGVEFPYLLYLCATKGPEDACKYQKSCMVKYPWRSRWYLGDCIGAVDRLKNGRFKEALHCFLPGGTDTYDDINWRDPLAFFGEICYYGKGFLKSGSTNPVQEGMIG